MRFLKIRFLSLVPFIYLTLATANVQARQHYDTQENKIKIGLLTTDNKSIEARQGAELAIIKANEQGGVKGLPIELINRSMEGPWGTGSKQAVNLIFDDNVWAIMGSHDGRNAHIIEQVTTKARVVFLSAWASDPTLSQAFVPWFFSCVPNDLQQASSLIDEIYGKRKLTEIVLVADTGYDSKFALNSFLKMAKLAGKPDPLQFFYNNSSIDFAGLIDQINKAGVKGIVLLGQPAASLRIIEQIRNIKTDKQIFGSLSVFGERDLTDLSLKNYEGVALISPGDLFLSNGSVFSKEYKKMYGRFPGAAAAFSFDVTNLLIEAIRSAYPDREKVQKSLALIHYQGVTGLIQFDEKGNRIGTPGLIEIKNGVPVPIKKD
jgi:branched-chain amino acid transport system substrate-binding protein